MPEAGLFFYPSLGEDVRLQGPMSFLGMVPHALRSRLLLTEEQD